MIDLDYLKGSHYPLYSNNYSCLIGNLPWYYGTDYLSILFRTDPNEVARYLPYPLMPSQDPGLCYVAFSRWVSLSGDQPDMAFVNPARTHYKEAAIWASCMYLDQPGQICLHIWVDKDFSMARGWFMGFPKRFGQIELTEFHPQNPLMKNIDVGSRLKGIIMANSERLIEGSLDVKEPIRKTELPYPFGSQLFHIRYFPSIERDAPPSVLELVSLGAEDVNYGDSIWKGKGSLKFFQSINDDFIGLSPLEILGAYCYSSGYSYPGGKVLHSWV